MKKLYRYVLRVRGMRCGMCEVHVEEHLTRCINNIHATAKRNKKQVIIESKDPIEEETINQAMKDCGYYYEGIIEQGIIEKKSFWEKLFKRG